MPNKALKDNLYNKDNNSGEGKEKYTALAMQESRLKKAREQAQSTGDWSEFNRLGGDSELKRLGNVIHTAQDANHSIKKIGKDTGRENQFIKKHEKDRDNANPTAIGGVPNVAKGSVENKIMNNQEVYNEGMSKELSEIRYLIEYMNNKKLKL